MNSPLDQYLDQLNRYLRFVPSQWRDEQIAEVRQHLTAHADELTLVGMTPYAAEEEAIRCFGSAPQTARSLIVAWWRQVLPLDVHTRRTALIAAIGFAGTWAMQTAVMPLTNADVPQVMRAPLNLILMGMDTMSLLTLIYWFCVGLLAGAAGKRRVLRSAFCGGVVGTVVAQITGRLQAALWMSDPQVRQQVEDQMAQIAHGNVHVIEAASLFRPVWIVMAFSLLCLGACLTARRQSLRRAVN